MYTTGVAPTPFLKLNQNYPNVYVHHWSLYPYHEGFNQQLKTHSGLVYWPMQGPFPKLATENYF